MPAFDPYFVATRMGAKYGLTESQEQVLRATLAGLPDDVACRFENRRRSPATLRLHRKTIFERMGWLDRLHCLGIVWQQRRERKRQLRRRAHQEVRELDRIHARGGR